VSAARSRVAGQSKGADDGSRMERDRVPKPKVNWNGLAEQRIQEAQADGQFENLPGFGKPIPGIDEPHDELWWVKDKLKREQISSLPPALAIRLDVQKTLEQLAGLSSETEVRREVASLNERIRKASIGPLWGPPVDVQPLDVEAVLECWRAGNLCAD
jgi:hypothetical protein